MQYPEPPKKPKHIWWVLGIALLCFSFYWRLFGLPFLDDPLQEIMNAAPMLIPLLLLMFFGGFLRSYWRSYKSAGDESSLVEVVKLSVLVAIAVATLVLFLYGV